MTTLARSAVNSPGQRQRQKTRWAAGRHLLLSCLLLVSVQTSAQAGMAQQYVPLQVGNSWTFVGENQSTRQFTVLETRELDGRAYFLLDDWFSPCCLPGHNDDADILFRYDPDGERLLQCNPLSQEDLVRYDFSGNLWGNCGHQLTETGLSVTVPAGQFDDAVHFAYATLVDCGIFHETLAPGVGPVTFYSSWQEDYALQEFTIVPEPVGLGGYFLLSGVLLIVRARRSARPAVQATAA